MDGERQLECATVKGLIHQSMQNLFGVVNGSHHIDVLRFDSSPKSTDILLRCSSDACDLLLQTLPTITFFQEKRCVFTVHSVAPLLTVV